MSDIYNSNNANFLLGILMNDCTKVLDPKFSLNKSDFNPKLFQKIIFATIHNLAINGVKEIDFIDVEEFLQNYPTQQRIYDDNDGAEFCKTIKELSKDKVGNIEYYYQDIRKHSLLRAYQEQGFDISEIWDVEKSDATNEEELNNWTIDKICEYFERKQVNIKKEFCTSKQIQRMIVGEDVERLLNQFEEEPMIGAGLSSPMLNSLYRGWCKGHLILRGSPSSFGKTLFGIADQCNVSCKKMWSEEKHDFIDNPYYQGMGAYIHTEQKMKEEIQPRFLSTIAQVPYNVILDGQFTKDQKERLAEAGHILHDSRLQLINYPDFDGSGIQNLIRELSLDGYEYITDDYMWNNFYIISDLKKITGNSIVREDQALLHFADVLKMTAEECNVGLASMIQLNGNQDVNELVDEHCLFGSKSIKTKLDNGSIFMSPRKKELSQVQPFIEKWNKKHKSDSFGNNIMPNAVSHVFKARYNRYGMNIKIWHHVDRSLGTMIDMFATTWDNKPLTDDNGKPFELPKLYITNDN